MVQKKTFAAVVLSLSLMIGSVAMAKAKKADTLYNRLGGKKAIVAVVNDFVGNCASDTRINSFFAKTAADPKRLAKFKGNLVAQICEAAGGPCKYKGKDMKTAHAGMGVKSSDFARATAKAPAVPKDAPPAEPPDTQAPEASATDTDAAEEKS